MHRCSYIHHRLTYNSNSPYPGQSHSICLFLVLFVPDFSHSLSFSFSISLFFIPLFRWKNFIWLCELSGPIQSCDVAQKLQLEFHSNLNMCWSSTPFDIDVGFHHNLNATQTQRNSWFSNQTILSLVWFAFTTLNAAMLLAHAKPRLNLLSR